MFLLAKFYLSDRFFKVREGSEVMDDTPTTSKKPEERFQEGKCGSFSQTSAKNSVSKFLSAPSEKFCLFFVVACC